MLDMFKPSPRLTQTLRAPSFGRRGLQEDSNDVSADDIWRGVAALHKLSHEAREDETARTACLFYALRHFHPSDTIDRVVEMTDRRIQAFQRLMGETPDLLDDEEIDATLEDAVYATIARTPLLISNGVARFDARQFRGRLPASLDREINARNQAHRLRAADREQLYLSMLH